MTDFLLKFPKSSDGDSERPETVVTLFDAWMDLRGHAASEDLILGNRSVAGFPLYLPGRNILTGYFFVSHPMPGLFYDAGGSKPRPNKKFLAVMEDVRDRYMTSLAIAVDSDIFTEFAELLRPYRILSHASGRGGMLPEALVDLSSDDPSGYMAAVLIPPAGQAPECSINEGAFARQLWSYAGLLSFFPENWQGLTDRMARFARHFERNGTGASLIWDSQEHTQTVDSGCESVTAYYPAGVRGPNVQMSPQIENWVTTEIHRRIDQCLSLYSSSPGFRRGPCPQADLVMPLTFDGVEGEAGTAVATIAGFIRFNCDSGQGDPASQRRLYSIVDQHAEKLNGSLGQLLALADSDLRNLYNRQDAGLFKQVFDAARQLTDWSAKCLAAGGQLNRAQSDGVGNSGDSDGTPMYQILKGALKNVWARMMSTDLIEQNDVTHRCQVLDKAFEAVTRCGKALASDLQVPLTMVTFWLRVWTPVIRSIEGSHEPFVELVMKDPGLLDVLQHLTITSDSPAIGEVDLCRTSNREVQRASGTQHRGMMDLGYPSHDAQLKTLCVKRENRNTLRITWTIPDKPDGKIQLTWEADTKQQARLLPASIAIVGGRLSERVARNIAAAGAVHVASEVSELLEGQAAGTILFVEQRDGMRSAPEFLLQLEDAFTDAVPDGKGHWTVLPLKRADRDPKGAAHLCILAPCEGGDRNRPIVAAARNLSLSRALARYRVQMMERERGYTMHRGTIAHGFRGAAGPIANDLLQLKGKAAQTDISSAELIETIDRLHTKVDAHGKLAEDALRFSRTFSETPVTEILTGKILLDDVDRVLAAFESPFRPPIKALSQLSSRDEERGIRYNRFLFRHALARLLENAVKQRFEVESQGEPAHLSLSVEQNVGSGLIQVAVRNSALDPRKGVLAIIESLEGFRENSTGLTDVRLCCKRSGLTLSYPELLDGNQLALTIGIPDERKQRR
jgi:hypothetical protein